MVLTPWGQAEELRERMLGSGPHPGPAAAERSQRERLFGAMVATCARQGYEEISVSDLIALAGVSRRDFYRHFNDKLACFVATVQELVDGATRTIAARLDRDGSSEERALSAFTAFVDLVVEQPAGARMVLVESYAAGEAGIAPVRAAIERVVELTSGAIEAMPERGGTPLELVRAIVGGFYRVIYDRLQSGREAELASMVPALWTWALSYRPPPQTLRLRGRRGTVEQESSAPPFAAYDPEQRLIRAFANAVAEQGYGSTKIADIAAEASISQRTFYVHFAGKAEAMEAALDSSGAQMIAATLPRARRADDWPSAVRVALEATCGFLAAEPAFAQLRIVEVYAAGPAAIAARDKASATLLGTLLGPAFEDAPEVDEIVLEAIGGAIYGVIYEWARSGKLADLPELAPLLTYLALAPFLGAGRACEVANGVGTAQSP